MIQEPIIIGKNLKYPLKGILTLPDNFTYPVPAVVLVHGSGSSNMDEKIQKVTPFKDIAEGLAAKGIASIRYNKRSFSYGLKMVMDKNTIITVKEETIDDAILATELLKNDNRIDFNKIFVIGHSLGGVLAPRIDVEGGNYAGLIIMAATPRKLEEVLIEQTTAVSESYTGFVKKIIDKQTKKLVSQFDGLYSLSDEEAKKKKVGGGTTLYYFKEMGENNTEKYLKNIDKPMLFLQGDKDFQVSVEKDFNLYKEILKDKENLTFELYEGLNHCFVPYLYENIKDAKKEYAKERHIRQDVIDDIADWIFQKK